MREKINILISSHVKANDIWYITNYFLKKHWKLNATISLGANGFYVTNYTFIHYTHFVEKGKFSPFLKDMLKKEELPLESKRAFLSEEELNKMKDFYLKKSLRKLVPFRYVNIIRKMIGKHQL